MLHVKCMRRPPRAVLCGGASLAALVTGFAASTPAFAQTSVIEEIQVTAQRREQSEQDVGIAIQTFTGTQLDQLGVETSFDVASFTPGVHISGNLAGQNTQFTIRGVAQNDFNDIVEAPIAVYVDDTYVAVAQAQTFGVFDIDRVEILKGPQGTLFGRNATGGAVQYITNKPSFDGYEGYVDIQASRFATEADAYQIRTEAAIGGPISENLAFRASVLYDYQEPLLQNRYPEGAIGGATFGLADAGLIQAPFGDAPGPDAGADLGDDDTIAGRFQIAYKATDRLEFGFAFNGARSELSVGPYQAKPTIGVFEENPEGILTSTQFEGNLELINVIDVAPNESRTSIGPGGIDLGGDADNDGVFGTPADGPIGRAAPGGDFFGYRDPDGEDFTFSSDFAFDDIGRVRTLGGSARATYELSDNLTIFYIGDYKDYFKELFIDVDAGPANVSANFAGVDSRSITQELRIAGDGPTRNWTAGLFYLNIDTTSANGLKFPVGSVVPGAPFDLQSDATLKTNSFSLFGQIEQSVLSNLTLIGGVRVVFENKDYVFAQNIYNTVDSRQFGVGTPFQIGPIFDENGVPQDFTDERNDTLWSGKVQLDYTPTDNLLFYAGVNRGVKAPSYNAQLAGGAPVANVAEFIPYDREALLSFEGGFKSDWFNGKMRLNGNIFYYDYTDYQAFLFTGVAGFVVNADANTIGTEWEIQATPIEGLDLAAGFAYFDATVEDVPLRIGDGAPVSDVDPVYAPEFQANGLIRYEWPMFGGYASALGVISYSDEYFYNLRNFDADLFDSYVLVNARLGWASDGNRYQVAFAVNNIADERIGVQGFDLATNSGSNEISFQPPRTYQLQLRFQY